MSTNPESMPLLPAKRARVYHGSGGDGQGIGEAGTGDENQQLGQGLEGDGGAPFGTIAATGGFLAGGVTEVSDGGGRDSSRVDGSNNNSISNDNEGGSAREMDGSRYLDGRGRGGGDTRDAVDDAREDGYEDGDNSGIAGGGSGVNVIGSGRSGEGLRHPPCSSQDLEGRVALKMEGEEAGCDAKDRVDASQRSGGSFANDCDDAFPGGEKKGPEVGDCGANSFNADVRADTGAGADMSNVGAVVGTQERRQEAVTSDGDGYYRVEDTADTTGVDIRNITTSSTTSSSNEYAFYGGRGTKGGTLCRSEAGRPFGLIESSGTASGSGQGETSIGQEFSRSGNVSNDDDVGGTKEGLNAEVNAVMSDIDAGGFSGWDNDRT